ncbi:hypothetical protein FN846DRAFT_971614 [Sphaerosporella brunnea]|uniref:Uncharacterized protein n=1 Tax=Sphaerosporella brunnea TaxID=1250544 RepID=A0A5J5EHV7_9PEZI|nr:hypothetical protein FN846DRAFT_971614 [Sphaerosporella brunnea]
MIDDGGWAVGIAGNRRRRKHVRGGWEYSVQAPSRGHRSSARSDHRMIVTDVAVGFVAIIALQLAKTRRTAVLAGRERCHRENPGSRGSAPRWRRVRHGSGNVSVEEKEAEEELWVVEGSEQRECSEREEVFVVVVRSVRRSVVVFTSSQSINTQRGLALRWLHNCGR